MDVIEIHHLGPGDEPRVAEAADLFDGPPDDDWTRAFLDEPTHHLLVAYGAEEPVGFVSAVETIHPDKGREMFMYELGVADAWRRRGVATRLIDELAALSRDRGCYDLWVLVDGDNEAALALYRSTSPAAETVQVLLEWRFEDDDG